LDSPSWSLLLLEWWSSHDPVPSVDERNPADERDRRSEAGGGADRCVAPVESTVDADDERLLLGRRSWLDGFGVR
jgi:hypothetical protein